MDVRSGWLCRLGYAAALALVFAVLCSIGFNASAQTIYSDAANASSGQPLKLAQYYYYPNYPYPQVRRKKVRPRRRAAPKCPPPWTYSRGLQRCICVKDGYGLTAGKCVKTGTVTYAPSQDEKCLWPRVEAREGEGCACAQGYTEQAGHCVLASPGQVQKRVARKDELLTKDVSIVQQCLKEAGYLRSNARSTMDKPAWTAFWFFKQDYSVGRTPKGIHDAKAQHALFALCPGARSQLALLPPNIAKPPHGPAQTTLGNEQRKTSGVEPEQAALTPPAEGEVKPAPEVKAPVKKVYARPEAGCLPGDLHELITRTYGPRPALKKCTQTCIAMPANITKREIEEFETKRGVRWCRSCIEIGTQLPLEDILKIERGANVQVCTRPPSKLPKWAQRTLSGRPAYTKVRELFRAFPKSVENGSAFAVIVGSSTYQQGVPENTAASANAGAIYALLTEHMGFEQENIVDVRDAKLEDLTRIFGKAGEYEGELWQRSKKNPDAKVFVYYSGHAGTRADATDSYLLGVDAVKYREERSGYPMSHLYASLQKLEAESVLVMLDAGFGRDMSDYVFPPNLPEMQVRTLPEKPLPGISVLTASDGDQKTLDDPEYGIGLFTRYLIEGLAGRADLAPIGNGDRKIDAVELYAYTSHMVRLSARKSFGLLQKPIMSRTGNLQVSRVQVQGQ